MGNLITNRKAGEEHYLKLSNGSTSVLLSVLVLSGSDMAETEWEKGMILWLSEKDQGVYGIGTVGFDIDDIAWKKDTFTQQKEFLLKTIDLALKRHRWDVLGYDPPFVSEQLLKFRSLAEQYGIDFLEEDKEWDLDTKIEETSRCPVHDVYLHTCGCIICNDR